MPTLEKINTIKVLSETYINKQAIIMFHYKGLTVKDLTSLRKKLKQDDVKMKVAKNTLLKLAAANNNIPQERLTKLFTGPMAVACSDDVIKMSKTIAKFAETCPQLQIVGCIVEKNVYDKVKVMEYATLPTIEESIANIIGALTGNVRMILAILRERIKQLENKA